MANKHNMLAAHLRQNLIGQLGGKCVRCGSKDNLEFDHIYGRDWDITRVNQYGRHLRYQREIREGKIQLLCRQCNLERRGFMDSGCDEPGQSFLELIADCPF